MSASEFLSDVQAQAAELVALAGTVDDGTGTPISDRATFEVADSGIAVGPCILISPPAWAPEGYGSTARPAELTWRLWVIMPSDDQTVARLMLVAFELADALEAAGRGDSDYELLQGAVVKSVGADIWPYGLTRVPAYVVQIDVPLP